MFLDKKVCMCRCRVHVVCPQRAVIRTQLPSIRDGTFGPSQVHMGGGPCYTTLSRLPKPGSWICDYDRSLKQVAAVPPYGNMLEDGDLDSGALGGCVTARRHTSSATFPSRRATKRLPLADRFAASIAFRDEWWCRTGGAPASMQRMMLIDCTQGGTGVSRYNVAFNT